MSASPTLSERDKLVHVTPELVVWKRCRSFVDEEDEGKPSAKASKMDDLKNQLAQVIGSLGEIKGKMLVKEDMAGLKDRLAGVESGHSQLVDQQLKLQARIGKLEGRDKSNGTTMGG